ATYLTPVMLSVSTACLVGSFLIHDFSLRYVAAHSNLAMEPIYTWVAFYAGNEGSLLYIALAFSVLASAAIALAPRSVHGSLPYTNALLMLVLVFFLSVMASMANPFARLETPPLDGEGINPLLTHPGMFFHPPLLMLGLVGVTVPFAFAMGHLLAGRRGDEWVDVGRAWGLVVWVVLTIGLLLGAWWAYTILGWGGYWAWDPVENAGLLPWLPLTAFIHSITAQKRRGLFRMWNIALINIAYAFALYGMFMNRGGPVPSVHSFAQSTMGWVFLAFLAFNLAGSFLLFFWRYDTIKSAAPLESPLSRETAFLLKNLLFLGIGVVTLWGVLFPLLAELFQGETVTVARPFYDQVNGPLFLALLLLMGIGPLLPWRRASLTGLRSALLLPGAMGLLVVIIAVLVGVRKPLPLLVLGFAGMAAAGILREWTRGTLARHRKGEGLGKAFTGLIMANRPRYGGYIVHLAIVLLAFSVSGSAFSSVRKDVSLAPGEQVDLGGLTIRYVGATEVEKADRLERTATVEVYQDKKLVSRLKAGYTFYPAFSMAATRAGIRSTPAEDLYIIASEFGDDGRALFRIHVNPLVMWMWVAGPLFLLGVLVSLWPERSRVLLAPRPPAGATVPALRTETE
ncbi:MAG: heme lyase CcmF/NrfE family subunit, partial [Chloroflexi bacterium]|nr:heme lyase CcmF/NrfE family subunit [Chloroflexota bacterium]